MSYHAQVQFKGRPVTAFPKNVRFVEKYPGEFCWEAEMGMDGKMWKISCDFKAGEKFPPSCRMWYSKGELVQS